MTLKDIDPDVDIDIVTREEDVNSNSTQAKSPLLDKSSIVTASICNNNCDKSKKLSSQSSNDEEKVQEDNKKVGRKRYIGILLALFAAFMFPLAGLIVKGLPEYHPFSVTFWRFQGILLPAIPMALYHSFYLKQRIFHDMDKKKAPFLFLRGLAGASAVVFQYYSLQYISLADSCVISFSTPVFVTIISHFTLGEKCGIIPILSGLCALVGVVILARPPLLTGEKEFDLNTLIGCLLALGCMICATTTFVVLRHLRQLHYAGLNLFFGTWGMLETLLLSIIVWKFQLPQGAFHWGLAVALAAISFVTQLCMTLSFKFEQASTISLVRTVDVIFTFGWQFIVFGVIPDLFSVLGAVVVISGVLLVGLRKWVTELPAENGKRKKLAWVLL